MKRILERIWNEPAVATGVPTVIFAAASGIWSNEWLAFLAAAWAGLGMVFTRQNSEPLGMPSASSNNE